MTDAPREEPRPHASDEVAALYESAVTSRAYYPALGLFEREVRRFLSVPVQTLAAPIGSALIYFTIFHFSIGRLAQTTSDAGPASGAGAGLSLGLDYLAFLVPGIMALEAIGAAFQNPVSSLMIAKWSGNIADQLMAPLSARAMWGAYIAGCLIRCIIVALATFAAGLCFAGSSVSFPHLGLLGFALVLTSLIFGGLGVLAGVLCKDFDQVGMITTFVLQPLTFLSGVFFSFSSLPQTYRALPFLNPAFYVVSMFRHALVGRADISMAEAFGGAAALAVASSWLTLRVLSSGRGLRS